MEIRAAQSEDLREWFGSVPMTMRAIVAKHDGRVLGVAGLALADDHVQAFSAYKPELRRFPVTMARAAIMFRQMLSSQRGPVFALCSETEPTAPDLLAKLGFVAHDERMWRHG